MLLRFIDSTAYNSWQRLYNVNEAHLVMASATKKYVYNNGKWSLIGCGLTASTLFGEYFGALSVRSNTITLYVEVESCVQFQAMKHLENVKIWGKEIQIKYSKCLGVQLPKEGQPGQDLTKDYSTSNLHRF